MNKLTKQLADRAGLMWFTQTSQTERFIELIIDECRVALSPMLRDMISRGQAHQMIKDHLANVNHDWLIRKVPNTKDDYYVEHGTPPAHVLKAYGITQ